MSINFPSPALTAAQVANSDHDIMQVWLYSGWGFTFDGCTCGAPNVPCTQSVEVGTEVDTTTTENFFIFSTNNGYNTDCFVGVGGGCEGEDGVANWVIYSGNSMMGNMTLTPSSSGHQYELPVTIEWGGSGSGWWVESGVNEVTSTSSTVIINTAFQGYFTSGSYTGSMSEGEAQTFQAGGEVADSEGLDGGVGWRVPMGSGANPSNGYPSAAYFHDVYAAGTNPTIGPVTEPLNYTYSTSAAAGSSSWLQWFYLGDGNDTYTWHAYSTPQPSTIPTLWVPPSPTLGSNAITIAPVYVYDTSLEAVKFHLFVLVANAPSGNNRAVQTYSSLTNAWTDVTNSTGGQVYVWGITTDSSNGAFWGWTHFSSTGGGQIWTSDGASSITLQAGWPGFSSAAAVDSLEVLATNLTDIGLDSYLVAHGFMPGNNWQDSGVPGYQVTADSIYGSIYVLESGGRVWIYEGGDEVEITNAKCGGGTLSFVQIAAKNGIIYGLDSSRTVHYYTYATNCWAQVGTKTGFAYSIATDNGDFAGVWASDGSGNIWTAE